MNTTLPQFRFSDLFAGLGGFHLAASSLGGKCIFASEIAEDLQGVYQKNFDIKAHGDIPFRTCLAGEDRVF